MDATTLQNRIYKRYAHYVNSMGRGIQYQLHRPTTALNAIPAQIGTINASFNAMDFGFSKPNRFGKAEWFAILDGRLTHVGDYLIESGRPTYFIAAMQLNLPIYVIECNRTITVSSENLENSSNVQLTPILSGWPCSILETGTRVAGMDSPGSIGQGEYMCIMPYFSGVNIITGYTITDDLGNNYIVRIVENSGSGWRMKINKVHQ